MTKVKCMLTKSGASMKCLEEYLGVILEGIIDEDYPNYVEKVLFQGYKIMGGARFKGKNPTIVIIREE